MSVVVASWVYDDAGRAAAGFKGEAEDCATRAVAIAADRPYRSVYDDLNLLAKEERPRKRRRSSAREGVHSSTLRRYMDGLGWEWVPTMRIGGGTEVHLRADELPPGRLVVRLSRHYAAVVDGVVRDTHDPSRGGTRAVYGYWRPL